MDPETVSDTNAASIGLMTFAEFLKTRWAEHTKLVQNKSTRRNTAAHVCYIAYYLGDVMLHEVGTADVNRMIESLHRDGPISFKKNKDGTPRKRTTTVFKPGGINRILTTLRAALNFAAEEGPPARGTEGAAAARG